MLHAMAAGGFSALDVLRMLEPEAEEPIVKPAAVSGLDVQPGPATEPAPAVTTAAAAGDEEAATVAPPGRRRAKHVV